MAITAEQVKELRDRTGAGIMDCKKILTEAEGNMDKAIEIEERLFGNCFETDDQIEGMTAFLEKRKVEKFVNK